MFGPHYEKIKVIISHCATVISGIAYFANSTIATSKQPASKDKVNLKGILGKTPSVFGTQLEKIKAIISHCATSF